MSGFQSFEPVEPSLPPPSLGGTTGVFDVAFGTKATVAVCGKRVSQDKANHIKAAGVFLSGASHGPRIPERDST